jgi:hypothetical protein
MADNTLTLALFGEVPLQEFTQTMQHFTGLVNALSREIGRGIAIEWVIQDLQGGSATATIIGNSEREDVVERVVQAYSNVGEALERGRSIPYSDLVQREARAITQVLNGKITSIVFQTSERDSTIASISAEGTAEPTIKYAYGIAKGTVETLTRRNGLSFILYDSLTDKAVRCYLSKDQEDLMRNAWGKRVIVSGRIGRESTSGRAVNVREIADVTIIEGTQPSDYTLSKGVIPAGPNDEKPEDAIRRLRDAY